MLDAIVTKCREPFDSFYYVGDMPDDMLAAARSEADCKGIGVLLAAPDKESLRKDLAAAGADYIIENFETLTEIML